MLELAATNSIARLTVLILVFGLVVVATFVSMTLVSRRAAVRGELRQLIGYTLVRLVLVFALPLGYVLLAYSGEEAPSFVKVYLIGSIVALLGLYFPNLY